MLFEIVCARRAHFGVASMSMGCTGNVAETTMLETLQTKKQ
jgi:hypothetical protein